MVTVHCDYDNERKLCCARMNVLKVSCGRVEMEWENYRCHRANRPSGEDKEQEQEENRKEGKESQERPFFLNVLAPRHAKVFFSFLLISCRIDNRDVWDGTSFLFFIFFPNQRHELLNTNSIMKEQSMRNDADSDVEIRRLSPVSAPTSINNKKSN